MRALTRTQLMRKVGQPVTAIDMWSGRRYTKIFDGDLRGYHRTWIAFDFDTGGGSHATLSDQLPVV